MSINKVIKEIFMFKIFYSTMEIIQKELEESTQKLLMKKRSDTGATIIRF
jgi:hypothetical protein